MAAWLFIPTTVIAVIAAGTLIFKFGTWVSDVNADRREFRDFMKEVRADIREIRSKIESILDRLPPVPARDGSPLRLTDLGERITKTLGGRAWAQETAAVLAERAQGKQPYDIQELCTAYVREEFAPTAELDAQIKACAYESSLKREQVLEVLAIELRDVLLELSGQPVPRARSDSKPSLHSA